MKTRALKYSDICLVPRLGLVKTRSDCDTTVEFCGRKFNIPVMPSNMKAVIDVNLAKMLSAEGYFYSMHRFDVDIQRFVDIGNREGWSTISISIGVKSSDRELIRNMKAAGSRIDFITIDIAHGDSAIMKQMVEYVKKHLPDTKLIAGNVATSGAVKNLTDVGADAVKVGIGQGSPCTTKDKTGFTMPMYTCVSTCAQDATIPIIADGGVTCNGDIAKALHAGASMVMAGGLFASCVDSPAAAIEIDGVVHKAYFGSASFENKLTNKHIEGKLKNIASNGMTYMHKLVEIQEDLQSSISYAGGIDLSALRGVDYYRVT